MSKLFAQEVPEIYDIVEVKAVARDRARAKIAVSRGFSVDPVGAASAWRSRVQAVVNELGQKIDIIPWTSDGQFHRQRWRQRGRQGRARRRQRMEVVVRTSSCRRHRAARPEACDSRRNSPAQDIDIVTEQEESEHRQAEFEKRTKLFIDALNVDEVVGQLLASGGFNSVEELALVDEKEIAGIEGFDLDTAHELQARAAEYLAKLDAELDAKRVELGVEDGLREVPGVTTAMLVEFGENAIKTVEDLADAATDDLAGWSERKDGETIKHPAYSRRCRARRPMP